MTSLKEHPIAVVHRRTGLSPHVIRKWEERYHVVSPERSAGGRRLYSEDDIQRLALLQRAVSTGHSIGQIARLSEDKLREYIQAEKVHAIPPVQKAMMLEEQGPAVQKAVDSFTGAARVLNEQKLRNMLSVFTVDFGQNRVVEVLIPAIMSYIGESWQRGNLRIVHEHLATTAVRSYLQRTLESISLPDTAPVAIAATITDQNHDIGALASAVVAAISGWHAVFLGADTPIEEIAAAAASLDARSILLSFTYPYTRNRLLEDLSALMNVVSEDVRVFIGGAPTDGIDAGPLSEGIVKLSDFSTLRDKLRQLNRGL